MQKYFQVILRLRERAKLKPGTRSAKRRELESQRNKRTNCMLIAMVVIFGGCWLPLNMTNLLSDLVSLHCWSYYHLTFFLCHLLAMSSTCYNPFLYGWLNSAFRKEFRAISKCCQTQKRFSYLPKNSYNKIKTEEYSKHYCCIL